MTTYADWELKNRFPNERTIIERIRITNRHARTQNNTKQKRNNNTSIYKYVSYEEITYRDLTNKYAKILHDREHAIKWIYEIFEKNRLDIIEFYAWLILIKNMDLVKIHGMVLEGPMNAGKSMIIDCTVRSLKPEDNRERGTTMNFT